VGSWALKCPAHGRLIRTDGEALEQQHNSCTSTGLVQRTHEVTVDADGNLCVRLNTDSPYTLPSDFYNVPQQTACVQTSIGFQARKRRATQAVQAKLQARQEEHIENPATQAVQAKLQARQEEHIANPAPPVVTATAGAHYAPAHSANSQGTTTQTPIPSLRQAKIYDMFRSLPVAAAAEMMETD
jgi:hypothetical protein